MTRAKDISKILTDADLSGTLDVAGELQVGVDGTTAGLIRLMDSGSVTEEATISTDANGGLIFGGNSGPGELIFRTGSSTKRMDIDSGGDISFYEDTGTTPKLFWDASAERLGIGTSSPSHELTVAGSTDTRVTIDGSNSAGLYISDSGANGITIRNTNDGDLEFLTVGGKEVVFNQLSADTDFRVESDNNTHALFVQGSDGNVGINETNPQFKLDVEQVGGDAIRINAGSDFSGLQLSSNNGSWSLRTSTADMMAFYDVSSATERMRIDSSGNVGIGGTSFNPKLYVLNNNAGPFLTAANATAVFHGSVDIGKGGCIGFDFGASHTNYPVGMGYVIESQSGSTKGSLVFGTRNVTTDTAPTERMRIDSSGNVAIGVTTAAARFDVTSNINPLVKFHQQSTANDIGVIMQHARGLSGFSGKMIAFRRNDGTEVGSVVIGVSSTSYNTSSDYRLKENVAADWDATTRLKQLNPVRFNFIADADTTVDGFLAHEVQSVVPEAITGTHNEVDDDGNPVYQGIDQSKLVPLLVKTIQELEARIVALETA